ENALPGELRVLKAAERSLNGERRGLRAVMPFLGPAFIAAVAYVDPGNFATNMAGGSRYGYMLLWVVLSANLMAMLIQSMSAKLGIATGKNLPEVCRDRFPRPVTIFLWVQAELIAMATDLAEFVGAALGLNLLFGIPLFPAALLTGVAAFGILALQAFGFRRPEASIAGLISVAMLTTAAAVFNSRGLVGVGSNLNQVYNGLEQYLGSNSGLIFGVALLASGISSSSVGTLAGQVVMQGFIRRRISIF